MALVVVAGEFNVTTVILCSCVHNRSVNGRPLGRQSWWSRHLDFNPAGWLGVFLKDATATSRYCDFGAIRAVSTTIYANSDTLA